ncbi:NUDIX hydrolase [Fictibacillus nanhaiensis]|uniref:NUDIX hydrolase n=1 Tax=Fictibacillus nanhaiensis TaxID=742169 RepID=UPI001C989072|nr:NUDIX hydrolase [Fictibacillus nanhaiensis]MBY6037727.1 NUDIX hydrolase [Fictibacillus nanhaiensis]
MDYIKHIRSLVGKEKVIMVVSGALVFDQQNRVLLQKRRDNQRWGIPGGFMEFNETVQETARREVFEETGLIIGKLDLFGIYSGSNHEKTFDNGDQVSMVQIMFSCREYKGNLIKQNDESLENRFFELNRLPADLFLEHQLFFDDLFSNKEKPIIE